MRSSARCWSSAVTPSQTFGNGHGPALRCKPKSRLSPRMLTFAHPAIASRTLGRAKYRRIASGRFVRIWYVCWRAHTVAANTRSRCSSV